MYGCISRPYVRLPVCLWACMHVRMHVCMYVCTTHYMYNYMNVGIGNYGYIPLHSVKLHSYISTTKCLPPTYLHACIPADLHTYIPAYIPAELQIHKHTDTHAYRPTCIQKCHGVCAPVQCVALGTETVGPKSWVEKTQSNKDQWHLNLTKHVHYYGQQCPEAFLESLELCPRLRFRV